MTKEDIIRMADEADLWADQELQCVGEYHPDWHEVRDVRFAALVAAAEREECAKVALAYDQHAIAPAAIAAAIRARGQA